jgi:hypothetical protein
MLLRLRILIFKCMGHLGILLIVQLQVIVYLIDE